jgi:hypothetical protein
MPLASQQHVVDELLGDWAAGRRPIGVVEGFAGIGKSELAGRVYKAWQHSTKVFVTASEGSSFDDLVLDMVSQLEASGHAGINRFAGNDYAVALQDIIATENILLLIDDFEVFLDPETAITMAHMRNFLEQIAMRPGSGKVLLITSRRPASMGWTIEARHFTLQIPEEDESARILQVLLNDRGLTDEVSADDLTSVCRWLGYNPRAMQAFVTCLLQAPLADLIDLSPDTWASGEAPSRALLAELESAFWMKTLGGLALDQQLFSENLAVFRRPFTSDAISFMTEVLPLPGNARESLMQRFILIRERNLYHLNPVVRALSLHRLETNDRRRRSVHLRAASFFERRIKTTSERNLLRSGIYFVEGSHHFHKADDDESVQQLGQRFRSVLRNNFRRVDIDTLDAAGRRELLSILTGAVPWEGLGFAPLRMILTRLYIARDAERDVELALHHAELASQESRSISLWRLLTRLTEELRGTDSLKRLGERAAMGCDVPSYIIREVAGHLVARSAYADALDLLDRTSDLISQEQLVYVESAKAFVLDRNTQTIAAIETLAEAFDRLKDQPNVGHLFEEACLFAFQRQDGAALNTLRELALTVDSAHTDQRVLLTEVLTAQLARDFDTVIRLGSVRNASYGVAAQVAFAHLCNRDVSAAAGMLATLGRVDNDANSWLTGTIAFCSGSDELFERAMSSASVEPLRETDFDDPVRLWLRVWYAQPTELRAYASFYHPFLPSALTGLGFDLERHSGDFLQLTDADVSTIRLPHVVTLPSATPDVLHRNEKPRTTVNVNIEQRMNMNDERGDTYINNGQSGAMGPSSRGFVSVENSMEWPSREKMDLALTTLLEVARSHSDETAPTAELHRALAANAEGNKADTLTHLRAAAAWIGHQASDVAAKVSVELLLRSIGM